MNPSKSTELPIPVSFSSKTDDKVLFIEAGFNSKRQRRTKPKVNVIPKDCGVPTLFRERPCDDLRMSMALNDLQISIKCSVVECVRDLAEAAANIWDNAALAKL